MLTMNLFSGLGMKMCLNEIFTVLLYSTVTHSMQQLLYKESAHIFSLVGTHTQSYWEGHLLSLIARQHFNHG